MNKKQKEENYVIVAIIISRMSITDMKKIKKTIDKLIKDSSYRKDNKFASDYEASLI